MGADADPAYFYNGYAGYGGYFGGYAGLYAGAYLDTLMLEHMLDTHMPVLMLLPLLTQPLPISSTPPDLESAPTTSVHEFLANLLESIYQIRKIFLVIIYQL